MALHTTVTALEMSLMSEEEKWSLIQISSVHSFSCNPIPEWVLQCSVVSFYILFMPYKEGNSGNVMCVLRKMTKLSALHNNSRSLRSIYQGISSLWVIVPRPLCGLFFVVGLFVKPKLFVFAEGSRWIRY